MTKNHRRQPAMKGRHLRRGAATVRASCQRLAGGVLAALVLWLLLPLGAWAAPEPEPVQAPSVALVRQSSVRLNTDFLDIKRMPATLSIDPLTPAEILDIQRSIHAHSLRYGPNITDSWMRSSEACMQWLFVRHAASEPWRAVGTKGGGNVAVLKVNGQMRHALSARYTIEHGSEKGSGLFRNTLIEVPGSGPGQGAVRLTALKSFSSYVEGQQQVEAVGSLFRASMDQKPIGQVFELVVLFTKDLRVETAEMPCTHMAARCRRYVGSFGQNDYYQFFSPDPRPDAGRRRIAIAGSGRAELAIEDMCPFAFAAMVQRPLNQRLAGGSGLEQYSIKGNPGLPGALAPYAK